MKKLDFFILLKYNNSVVSGNYHVRYLFIMYYVYVLKGPKQLYIGSTNDLKRRFVEHQNNKSISTKGRGPWKIVYYEASKSRKDSMIRETYLKTAWGRRYLRNRLKNSE